MLQLGLGVSSYVEITAADAEGGETAQLIVHDDGTATVYTGSSAHGQGHHTAWAMLVEAELGIEMAKVTVIHGDTDLIPLGTGTYGSRSLQLGGVAVHKAAVEVKEQARLLAADLLEASESDLELDTGQRHLAGPRRPGVQQDLGRGGQPRRRRRPDRSRSTTPLSPPSRSAPTSRSWRWTPRPARPG